MDSERTMRLVVMPEWLVAALRLVAVGALGLFAALFAYDIFGGRWKWPSKIALKSTGTSAVVAGNRRRCAGRRRAYLGRSAVAGGARRN